jgi:broad specificity phosphatase PhoE
VEWDYIDVTKRMPDVIDDIVDTVWWKNTLIIAVIVSSGVIALNTLVLIWEVCK